MAVPGHLTRRPHSRKETVSLYKQLDGCRSYTSRILHYGVQRSLLDAHAWWTASAPLIHLAAARRAAAERAPRDLPFPLTAPACRGL